MTNELRAKQCRSRAEWYLIVSISQQPIIDQWAHIRVWRKLSVWSKDACMRLSIFPNTYAEVMLLRLCEININAFLGNGSKQMPIMARYNSRLPFRGQSHLIIKKRMCCLCEK